MLLEMTANQIFLADAPALDGLTFRLFRDESDYAHIVEFINVCSVADGVEDHATVEWATNFFAHIVDFDPRRDILFAAIDDRPVGWVRGWKRRLDDGTQVYLVNGGVLPGWRRRGIGRALQHWGEQQLRELAAQQPAAGPRVFRSFAADTEEGLIGMLEQEGYQAIRYGFEMARPFTDPIPDLPLPEGVEVRAVAPEQYRQVAAALNEAFRDHWSHSESTEEDYQRWINSPAFQPHLWQVGWAGDEVAGMVLNFIDPDYNAEFKRLRGWTDPICVRRPWRKQGLAKALIARSMRLLQAQGMTEAGLGVDAQNPNGALRLYESLGFRVTKKFMTYEKPLD
jgi:ribosomal protein S18 acetylase RimI-like enzyme